ncbi:NlpC/P60 family protein [Pseudomaricurvus sp.]|uniref:NlpC/P60 family protein n=1 Tax=Pseudomaricurvus sp. TaxID=2004510 RepID=UPI003F6C7159
MNKWFLIFKVIFIVSVLAGCSHQPTGSSSQSVRVLDSSKANLNDTRVVQRKLYDQYQQWKGTGYAMGGLSRRGVDCSGLVYLTYRDQFGLRLPRSTKDQAIVGEKVKRSQLRSGDLVFFKTGFKVRHVGIYIEDGKFFHASTSRGVMISRLDDYYWKDKYWHSRRVR